RSSRTGAAAGRESANPTLLRPRRFSNRYPAASDRIKDRPRVHSKPHRLTFDGEAAHQTRLLAREVLAGVDREPVVPDHEVAELPLVLVDDPGILGDVEQL